MLTRRSVRLAHNTQTRLVEYMLLPRRKPTCRNYAVLKLEERKVQIRDIDSNPRFTAKVSQKGERPEKGRVR